MTLAQHQQRYSFTTPNTGDENQWQQRGTANAAWCVRERETNNNRISYNRRTQTHNKYYICPQIASSFQMRNACGPPMQVRLLTTDLAADRIQPSVVDGAVLGTFYRGCCCCSRGYWHPERLDAPGVQRAAWKLNRRPSEARLITSTVHIGETTTTRQHHRQCHHRQRQSQRPSPISGRWQASF